MNYGNRNASTPYTTGDLARGYSGAVATSVGIALASRIAFASQLSALKGSRLIMANAFLGYLSAAFAGVANCCLMRFKEAQEGIEIQSQDGSKTYGKSKIAGQTALF